MRNSIIGHSVRGSGKLRHEITMLSPSDLFLALSCLSYTVPNMKFSHFARVSEHVKAALSTNLVVELCKEPQAKHMPVFVVKIACSPKKKNNKISRFSK